MLQLYRHVVNASLDATDTLTAELVKTTENATATCRSPSPTRWR